MRPAFDVPGMLGNPHLQSVLASSHLRRRWIKGRRPAFLDAAEPVVLDAGDGVRLSGAYSPAAGTARGLVVLLHGWEGSIDSTYLLDAADHLHQAGFALFRLNLRDHGDSHALNPGIFHSCRIDEVVGAVADVARRFDERPLCMAGFSLGGNFTLRVALRAPGRDIPLAHALAVSPVICPSAGLKAIEDAPWIYETYFLRKWRRSLRKKQAAFPGRYDLKPWMNGNLRAMTRDLVEQFTPFERVEDYLDGYAIHGERLAALAVPATLVTAADDPVIPLEHFHQLALPEHCELVITDKGGHCGFIENLRLESWISRLIVDRMAQVEAPSAAAPNEKESVSC